MDADSTSQSARIRHLVRRKPRNIDPHDFADMLRSATSVRMVVDPARIRCSASPPASSIGSCSGRRPWPTRNAGPADIRPRPAERPVESRRLDRRPVNGLRGPAEAERSNAALTGPARSSHLAQRPTACRRCRDAAVQRYRTDQIAARCCGGLNLNLQRVSTSAHRYRCPSPAVRQSLIDEITPRPSVLREISASPTPTRSQGAALADHPERSSTASPESTLPGPYGRACCTPRPTCVLSDAGTRPTSGCCPSRPRQALLLRWSPSAAPGAVDVSHQAAVRRLQRARRACGHHDRAYPAAGRGFGGRVT